MTSVDDPVHDHVTSVDDPVDDPVENPFFNFF
jgi:hypothetical protein